MMNLASVFDCVSDICFQDIDVETPQGIVYRGKRMDTQKYCGVSVLRAGETMEPAICEVCKDIRLGKILIQTNNDTGEPEVSEIKNTKCLRLAKGGILAIFNSISTKKCNPPPILPIIQVSLELITTS